MIATGADPILIFIDKVDQAVLQPGAEIPECHDCYKDTKYDNCEEKERGIKYCLEECRDCCYGCEIYQSAYAGEEMRIYGTKYGKRYEHISQWQHLQLALVIAVDTNALISSQKFRYIMQFGKKPLMQKRTFWAQMLLKLPIIL